MVQQHYYYGTGRRKTARRPVGRGSVQAPRITASQFRATGNREETDVIGIREGQILTDHLHERIAIEDGDKRPDSTRDLVRIAVVDEKRQQVQVRDVIVKGFEMGARIKNWVNGLHFVNTDLSQNNHPYTIVSTIEGPKNLVFE